jgi:hypothetical protein
LLNDSNKQSTFNYKFDNGSGRRNAIFPPAQSRQT